MTDKYIWGDGTDSPDPITNTKLNQNVDYLDEQIADAASLGGQFAQDADTTAALVFGYNGGNFRDDNVITIISDGTITLTDATTNYVEVDASGVALGSGGFTSGKVPLFVIVTVDGAISTVTDMRSWASLGGGTGVGGVTSVNTRTGVITLNASDVGLSNVDNLSAATLQQQILDSIIVDGGEVVTDGDNVVYDAL